MMQIRGTYMTYHYQTAASRILGPSPPSLEKKRGRIPKGRAADDTLGDLKLTG